MNSKIKIVQAPTGCVDKDTEFLTQNGWVKISEYNGQDIAVWYPEDKTIGYSQFEKPLDYINTKSTKMYHYKSRMLDMIVSDNHKILYSTRNGKYHFDIVENIKKRHDANKYGLDVYVPLVSALKEWIGKRNEFWTDDLIRLQVAFCADGTIPIARKINMGGKALCYVRVKKEYKKERMRILLEKTNTKYNEKTLNGYSIFGFIPPVISKSLNDIFRFSLDENQLNIFCEELFKWDGSENNKLFRTTNKIDADFIQLVFQFIYKKTITIRQDNRIGRKRNVNGKEYITKSICYEVSVCESNKTSFAHNGINKIEFVNVTQQYPQMYCFTTSSGYWIARRNNIIYVCGNSGKTEKIAEEIIKHLKSRQKLIVVVPAKANIWILLNRVASRFDDPKMVDHLIAQGKIYPFYYDESEDYEERMKLANIIITHHGYFSNKGNVIMSYAQIDYLLTFSDARLIIDEVHTLIETISRIDVLSGGLYRETTTLGKTSWQLYTGQKLTKEQLNGLINLGQCRLANGKMLKGNFKILTNVMYPTKNAYQHPEIYLQNRVFDHAPYVDLVKIIKTKYKEQESIIVGHMKYTWYINNNVERMISNDMITPESAENRLIYPADSYLISENIGDDIPRIQIGQVMITFYHSQLLKVILNSFKSVILTSATISEVHLELLKKICTFTLDNSAMNKKIDKITNIVILRRRRNEKSLIKDTINTLFKLPYIDSLFLLPKISEAERLVKQHPNVQMNDNGFTKFDDELARSYSYKVQRNVTVIGMEATPAKGYNFAPEIDKYSKGLELLWLDKSPVSNDYIKKYIINNQLKDYKSDYNSNTFAQAIGRAMRKEKKNLIICLNRIDDHDYGIVKNYLETFTTSNIIEEELTLTNIQHALFDESKEHNQELIASMKTTNLYKQMNGIKE